MKNRQIVFKDEKFYCLSPYVTIFKTNKGQILLYRMDTKKRVLLVTSEGNQWDAFLDVFSDPIPAERALHEIRNLINTDSPDKILGILLRRGVLESCG